MNSAINLEVYFDKFDDTWSPKIVGELNGQTVKLVKLEGDKCPWHVHDNEDEMFLVVDGQLEIHQGEQQVISLAADEFFIVLRGIKHRVVPKVATRIILFEPDGTAHTGKEKSDITKRDYDRLIPQITTMAFQIHDNNVSHLSEFIRLNEQWIRQYFNLEETDLELARNPKTIIDQGGVVFTGTVDGKVIAACALFKSTEEDFELARMAVDPVFQGKGFGKKIALHALAYAKKIGAKRIYLLSNTKLTQAIALYRSLGFSVVREGLNPKYTRSNIEMEITLGDIQQPHAADGEERRR